MKDTFIEPTCAYARWALMHRILSVCMSVTGPKIRLDKKVTRQSNVYLSRNHRLNRASASKRYPLLTFTSYAIKDI